MRVPRKLLLVGLPAVAAAALGVLAAGGSDGNGRHIKPIDFNFTDHAYKAVRLVIDGSVQPPEVTEAHFISFTRLDGKDYINVGERCGGFASRYAIDGDRLRLVGGNYTGGALISMECLDDGERPASILAHRIEDFYLAAPQITLSKSRVVLTGLSGVITLDQNWPRTTPTP